MAEKKCTKCENVENITCPCGRCIKCHNKRGIETIGILLSMRMSVETFLESLTFVASKGDDGEQFAQALLDEFNTFAKKVIKIGSTAEEDIEDLVADITSWLDERKQG